MRLRRVAATSVLSMFVLLVLGSACAFRSEVEAAKERADEAERRAEEAEAALDEIRARLGQCREASQAAYHSVERCRAALMMRDYDAYEVDAITGDAEVLLDEMIPLDDIE